MTKKQKLINEIKSKGYWQINIHPEKHMKQLIPQQNLEEIIRNTKVSLKGWDYPHYNTRENLPYNVSDGVEQMTEWRVYNEFWKFNESGNYLHLKSLKEDWSEEPPIQTHILAKDKTLDMKWLGTLYTLYTLTEIFEFAKRLSEMDYYTSGVYVNVKLYDLNDRYLVVDSHSKMPFITPKICRESKPWEFEKSFREGDSSLYKESAFEAFLSLARLFNWNDMPVQNLKDDQQKFLDGKAW